MAAESVITTTITAILLSICPHSRQLQLFVNPQSSHRHHFLTYYSDKGICSSERLRYLLSVFSLQLNKLEFEHSSY